MFEAAPECVHDVHVPGLGEEVDGVLPLTDQRGVAAGKKEPPPARDSHISKRYFGDKSKENLEDSRKYFLEHIRDIRRASL